MFQKDQIGNVKTRAAGDLDNRQTERTTWKFFRCAYEYDLIAEFPKPPK